MLSKEGLACKSPRPTRTHQVEYSRLFEQALLGLNPSLKVHFFSKRNIDRLKTEIFDAQGMKFDHEIKWHALDRVLNGLASVGSYITGGECKPNDEPDFVTADGESVCEGKPNIFMQILDNDALYLSLLVTSIILFNMKKTQLTGTFYFTCLSMFLIYHIVHVGEDISLFTSFLPLWESLSKYLGNSEELDDTEEILPHGILEDNIASSALLTTIFNGIVGFKPKKSFTSALLQMTKTTDTQCKNISSAILWISGKLHTFLNDVCDAKTFAKYFEVDIIMNEQVSLFISKTEEFLAIVNSGNPASYAYCVDVYTTYLNEGTNLLKTLDQKSFEYKLMVKLLFKLKDMEATLKTFEMSLSGERIEPVGVLLKGASGVFKSVLMSRLGQVIASYTIPKEWKEDFKRNPKDFHYNLPSDSYYDGYTNKAWIAYADDIFQQRDDNSKEVPEAIKIIKLINSAPYTLTMASVSKKNTTYFRSAFLFATTNLTNWSSLQSVLDPSAVRRRFTVEVDVTLNPKYTTDGKIDMSKLPMSNVDISEEACLNGSCLPNDLWLLKVIEKRGNQSLDERNISMIDLIKLIIEKHYGNVKNYFVNTSSNKTMIDEITNELDDYFNNQTVKLASSKAFQAQSGLADYDDESAKVQFMSNFCNGFQTPDEKLVLDTAFYYFCIRSSLYVLCKFTPQEFLRLYYLDFGNEIPDGFRTIGILTLLTIALETFKSRCDRNHNGFTDEPLEDIPQRVSPIVQGVTKLKEFLSKSISFFKKYMKFFLIGSIAIIPILYYLSGFLKSVLKPISQSVDLKHSGKRIGVRRDIKLSEQAKLIHTIPQANYNIDVDFEMLPKLTYEDFGDQNNVNGILSRVMNKYFMIMYLIRPSTETTPQKVVRMGHVTNIISDIFLLPFHFIFQLNKLRLREDYKGATIVLLTSTTRNRYSMSLEEFMQSFNTTDVAAEHDMAFVRLKCAQTMSCGAISYFINDDDSQRLNRVTSFECNVLGSYIKDMDNESLMIRKSSTRARYMDNPIAVSAVWEDEDNVYQLNRSIQYSGNFSAGDCGSLLYLDETKFQSRVLAGIHIAGDGKLGFSTSITQEFLREALKLLYGDINAPIEEERPVYVLESTDIVPHSNLEPIGEIHKDFLPGDIIKSEITKSKVHDHINKEFVKKKTLPSRINKYMRDGVEVDPMRMALNRYGKQSVSIPSCFIDEAVKSYYHLISTHSKTKPECRLVIGLREALHSFSNVSPIASSTSAGFPMTSKNQRNLKKEYFSAMARNDYEEATRVYLRIATEVNKYKAMYMNKIRPFWAYKDCLKDEVVSFEKARQGKTRMFSGSPFIMLVMFRMYFGAFISDFIGANLQVGSAVGVNPYSSEWDSLARKLKTFSGKDVSDIGAGDFSAYDTTEFPVILNRIIDMINLWYGKGNDLDNYIRLCLWAEITNSRHIADGKIYEWFSGMPSGNPMTAIINTIYNNLVFRIAFQFANLDITMFNKLVYICALGDDNIFCAHKSIIDKFNEINMPEFMAKCGMKYTTELKQTASVAMRKLTEVEFLKRSFRYDDSLNRWVAPLREEVFATMLQWTKKDLDGDQITVDNMSMVLRESSLHGEEMFTKWRDEIFRIKADCLPDIEPHKEFDIDFATAYSDVCKLEYYF